MLSTYDITARRLSTSPTAFIYGMALLHSKICWSSFRLLSRRQLFTIFVIFALFTLTFISVYHVKHSAATYVIIPPFNDSVATSRLRETFGSEQTGRGTSRPTVPAVGHRRMFATLPGYSARLGNQMFGHAALLGLSHRYGFNPTMKSNSMTNHLIRSTFRLKTPVVTQPPTSVKVYHAPDDQTNELPAEILSGDHDVEMVGYFQTWKSFANATDIIGDEFQFQPQISSAASQVVERLMRSLPADYVANGSNSSNSSSATSKIVRVGIHIRRTDMALPIQLKRGYRVANQRYVRDAMNYVEKMIVDSAPSPSSVKLVYIVCTDEQAWAKAYVTSSRFPVLHSDVNFMDSGVDLAILASCDHVITSTGTYSWWAGFLASAHRQRERKLLTNVDQGSANELNRTIVVYYADFPPSDTEIGKHFRPEDLYPPWWIGLR